MLDPVRFWFRPNEGRPSELAARFLAAGHFHVLIKGDLVGMVPFSINVNPSKWIKSMQNHFNATLVKSE